MLQINHKPSLPQAQTAKPVAPAAVAQAPAKPSQDGYVPSKAPVVAQKSGPSLQTRSLIAGAAGALVGGGLMATMATIGLGILTGGLSLPIIAGAAALGALSGGAGLYAWTKEQGSK